MSPDLWWDGNKVGGCEWDGCGEHNQGDSRANVGNGMEQYEGRIGIHRKVWGVGVGWAAVLYFRLSRREMKQSGLRYLVDE